MKNFVGTFAPPFAVHQRLRLPAHARPATTGSAGWPRRSRSPSSRTRASSTSSARTRAALRAPRPAAMEELVRRSAVLHLEHIRDERRPVRVRLGPAAGLRPLGRPQAGGPHGATPSATGRRWPSASRSTPSTPPRHGLSREADLGGSSMAWSAPRPADLHADHAVRTGRGPPMLEGLGIPRAPGRQPHDHAPGGMGRKMEVHQ